MGAYAVTACGRCGSDVGPFRFGCCAACCVRCGVKPGKPRGGPRPPARFCDRCGDRLASDPSWPHRRCADCRAGRTPAWKLALRGLAAAADPGATATRPGSLQRIAVYCARVERGRRVFHPGDVNGE